jgi:aldose 1-epimerase
MQKPAPSALTPVVITHQGRTHYQAAVTPGYGANLISFQADGTEMIYFDEARCRGGNKYTGAFNMFPTPCRLANCSYSFEGRTITQNKRGEQVFIHGLVRDEAFSHTAEASRITSWIDINPASPLYEGFPFTCTFRVIHSLDHAGLTVTFQVVNRDARRLPFGYGIHPYWRIHGSRDEVRLRIPCDRILESKELVPTGNTLPVEGTPLDLRALKPLGSLTPDHVFWQRAPGDSAELSFDVLRKKIVFEASAHFAHMIVYTIPDVPYVCVENLTTCPNGQNVAASGDNSVANLLTAAPGETVEGWVRFSVRPVNS